jgi:GMP synthase-like glutamine amidotransferase
VIAVGKKALVIQHAATEGPGTIAPALRRFGLETHYVRIFKDERVPREVEGYHALIVLGGPMGVYEEAKYPFITDELYLVEKTLKAGLPLLGICLGAQVLAAAAGARVYRGRKKEIGWYPVRLTTEGQGDMLFLGLPEELNVFHWHGDTFDVPPGGTNLASSELYTNQLLRVGKNAYGIQFHLEVTSAMIREWIEMSGKEIKTLKMYPERIIKESTDNINSLHRYSEAVFSRFLRLMDL